jgi:carbon-monoxide dehydrogenase medium subunit
LSWQAETRLYMAPSLDDAVAALAERGRHGALLAGATWIMRAPLRQERHDLSYVAISKIAALRELSVGDREVSIGACVTHAELARELAAIPDCRALAWPPAMRPIQLSGKSRQSAEIFARQILRPQTLRRRCYVLMPSLNCKGRATLSGFR